MSIPSKDLKALLQKSGNRCAFPECSELLLQPGEQGEDSIVLSKIAHIVAESPDGPRGRFPLPSEGRNRESNLLLLCGKHHDIIDSQPHRYTVERLRQMKEDHEALIGKITGQAVSIRAANEKEGAQHTRETLFSTLFPVIALPAYIYFVSCEYTEAQKEEIREKIVRPQDATEIYPYIIRAGNLYVFQNLNHRGGPFQKLIDSKPIRRVSASEWWDDPVKHAWFASLLNRSLNKLTGRKGLQWDRDHRRYYFQPDTPGQPKEVSYRPLNQSTASKQVAWQPISKRTGQPRHYWLHRAVNLRFHRVATSSWCFSIRPEFRVTTDGFIPALSERVGSKVTRKKSRMFNYDLLGEVNFWREFLGDSEPRIYFNYGKGQRTIVSTMMMHTEIEWPGIPEEFARPFKNIEYDEDLFTWAKLAELDADLDSNPSDEGEDEEETEEVGEDADD